MTDKPRIPPEYFEALGRVSNIWATLEFSIDQLIYGAANISEQVGTCFIAQFIGPNPRIRALVSLLKFRGVDQALIDEVNQFSESIGGLAAERNRLMHDPMFIEAPSGKFYRHRRTADRTLRWELNEVDLQKMKDLHKKIEDKNNEFVRLRKRIIAAFPRFPKITTEPPRS